VAQPIINQQNQVSPDQKPTQPGGFDEAAFWNRVNRISLPTEDCRNKGGALWVTIPQTRYPTEDQWLESLGFKYKSARGWWRE